MKHLTSKLIADKPPTSPLLTRPQQSTIITICITIVVKAPSSLGPRRAPPYRVMYLYIYTWKIRPWSVYRGLSGLVQRLNRTTRKARKISSSAAVKQTRRIGQAGSNVFILSRALQKSVWERGERDTSPGKRSGRSEYFVYVRTYGPGSK